MRGSKVAKSGPTAAVPTTDGHVPAATVPSGFTTNGGPNADPPSTPSAAALALPPQTPVQAAPAAASNTPASVAERLANRVASWGIVAPGDGGVPARAPNLSTVETFVGSTVGVNSSGDSRVKAFTTTSSSHTKPDKVRITGLSVDLDVDLDGLDNFGNKLKVTLCNRGKKSQAEQQLIKNVACQILHTVWAKQNRGNVQPGQTDFADYVAGSKNCVNAEGQVVVRTAYSGVRYVTTCSDGSLEHLSTKGKLSPDMVFDAELTFQYWKYKGNYGVSASVHRIIVTPPAEPEQATFVSGATQYGHAQ